MVSQFRCHRPTFYTWCNRIFLHRISGSNSGWLLDPVNTVTQFYLRLIITMLKEWGWDIQNGVLVVTRISGPRLPYIGQSGILVWHGHTIQELFLKSLKNS